MQIGFLILFLLWFFLKQNNPDFYTIGGVLLLLITTKIVLYGFQSDYIKMMIFFILTILSVDDGFVLHAKDLLVKLKAPMILYMIGLNIYLLIMMLKDSSYYNMYEESYFTGSMHHPHTMAYACMFIILFIIILSAIYMNKWLLLLAIIPIYGINLTGVRTVVIALLIPVLVYLIRKIKRLRDIIVFVFAGGIIVIFSNLLVKNSLIVQKFLLANEDITSGRSTFWLVDLMEYVGFNPLEKLLGSSFDYLIYVNYKSVGMSIGAHNDVITWLFVFGIIGLLMYISLLVIYCKNIRLEFVLLTILLLFLNGYYTYSELVYIMPLLVIVSKLTIDGNKSEKGVTNSLKRLPLEYS
jgi:hypothetical protein